MAGNDTPQAPLVRGTRLAVVADYILADVSKTLQLALLLLLLGAGTTTLIAWVLGVSDTRLKIPLLLVGLAVISLGIVLNKGGASVVLGILIVGILVAPRDYLLRIAHMISRPDAPFEEYARRYEGERAATASPDELVNRVLTTLEGRGVELNPATRKAIDRVLTQEELSRLASRAVSEEADFPLREIMAGGSRLRSLIRDFGHEEFFREDMEFLRREGLVEFEGTDYASAQATDLGRRVAGFTGPAGGIEPFDVTGFDPGAVQDDEWEELGVPSRGTFYLDAATKWFRFRVQEDATYAIDVRSVEGDPVIALFGPNGFTPRGENDDFDGLNSRLERTLEVGRYFLGVRNIRPIENGPVEFEVIVSRATSEDLGGVPPGEV